MSGVDATCCLDAAPHTALRPAIRFLVSLTFPAALAAWQVPAIALYDYDAAAANAGDQSISFKKGDSLFIAPGESADVGAVIPVSSFLSRLILE